MTDGIVTNPRFTVSARALAQIDVLTDEIRTKVGEADPIPSLSWGESRRNGERLDEGLVIGFYPRDQEQEIAEIIHPFGGKRLAVFMMPEKAEELAGLVIDWSEERRFFVRPPESE